MASTYRRELRAFVTAWLRTSLALRGPARVDDGPWDETDPLFYEMYDDAMDF